MAISDVRLAMLSFGQRWQPNTVQASLLLIPSGDPTQPLFPATADTLPFAGTDLHVRVAAVPGLEAMPTLTASSDLVTLSPPAGAAALFNELATRFGPQDSTVGPPPPVPPPSVLRKALPDTYVALLPPGGATSPYVASLDEFSCTMRGQVPVDPPPTRPAPYWGEIISHALRNPALATALGLRYPLSVPIADPASFADGGWLFVTLDSADGGTGYGAAWATNPDAVRVYAARLPALTTERAIFTAVLFPVANPAAPPQPPDESALDEAIIEAEAYDDGFAKLVHARQPDSIDAHVGDDTVRVSAASDVGIQIGWDDEQVLTWHNRQAEIAQQVLTGSPVPIESPLGVQGYRVDVREPAPNEPPSQHNVGWTSLMQATGTPPDFGSDVGPFVGELVVEPTASGPAHGLRPAEFWLPLYFAQWQGLPIGVRDDTPHLLAGGVASGMQGPVVPSAFVGADVPRLLYGHAYEVRVRLGDQTGGGPTVDDLPINETTSERARVDFARYVSPNAFRLPLTPVTTDITLTRPAIGYPEALFTTRYGTRADVRSAARSAMLAQLGLAPDGSALPPGDRVADTFSVGVPDPDVTSAEIRVEVRALAHDTGDDVSADGIFTTLYVTSRPFPALTPLPATVTTADVVSDVTSDLTLDIVDVDDVATLQVNPPPSGPIVVPRARDVRLVITPIASGPDGYFGVIDPTTGRNQPTRGASTHVTVRLASDAEADPLFAPPASKHPPVQAYFFQPTTTGDPVAAAMSALADQLDLVADGLTLRAPPGQRVVFGAAAGVASTIAPDGSAITFAAAADLFRTWTVGLTYDLVRDWTWDGLTADQVSVTNGGTEIGVIVVPRIINEQALFGAPDRSRTRLVFLDRIDPAVPNAADGVSDRPPYQLSATVPTETNGPLLRTSDPVAVRLPVVVPPAGVPRLASAGYALSPYQAAADYSSTSVRDRRLWLELDVPPDPGDAVFARVLAYAPDPLLYVDPEVLAAPPPTEPALRLDPELIRVITPDQPRDEDGSEAMIPLTASATDPTRFLLPLPDGVAADDPRLFGMWTYELRYGHVAPWSTAHGRFGRPLRVTGVQHPAPPLSCAAWWGPTALTAGPGQNLVATASFATSVLNGRQVGIGGPWTTIGFLLYAQALQADRSAHRNVLLGTVGACDHVLSGKTMFGEGTFQNFVISDALTSLGLPQNSPLSVLAVEFYRPGGVVGAQYHRDPAGGGQPPPVDDQCPNPFDQASFGTARILRTSPLVPVQPLC